MKSKGYAFVMLRWLDCTYDENKVKQRAKQGLITADEVKEIIATERDCPK